MQKCRPIDIDILCKFQYRWPIDMAKIKMTYMTLYQETLAELA